MTDADRLALLHPGSGGSARDWKPENFALLAAELKKRGFYIVITGGKSEAHLVQSVARAAGEGVEVIHQYSQPKRICGVHSNRKAVCGKFHWSLAYCGSSSKLQS